MSAFTAAAMGLLLGGSATPTETGLATVTVEGTRRPVQTAYFGINLQTEVWDEAAKSWRRGVEVGRAAYWLNVTVDEHSGEDGAPAPAAEDIPVLRANGGRHPGLDALGALTVREQDDCESWDAWFGNDAPGLCANVLRFQGWTGDRLGIRWEAEYDHRGRARPFLFEGPAVFAGIYVRVPAQHDPDEYLRRVWGGEPAGALDRHPLSRKDNGPGWPAEWRHTASYVYVRKGQPLPAYWTPQRGLAGATPAPSPTK